MAGGSAPEKGHTLSVGQIKTLKPAFPDKLSSMEFDDSPRQVYASSDYLRDAILATLGIRVSPTTSSSERVAALKGAPKP